MTKGVDHFGDCFVYVGQVNRLFSGKYWTFSQMSSLSMYFPFSLAFLLCHNTDYSTLALHSIILPLTRWWPWHMLPTWWRSDKHDIGLYGMLTWRSTDTIWRRFSGLFQQFYILLCAYLYNQHFLLQKLPLHWTMPMSLFHKFTADHGSYHIAHTAEGSLNLIFSWDQN